MYLAMKRAASMVFAFAVLLALLPAAGTAAAPPANTVVPEITGTPAEGTVLTVSTGTWTGTGTITYTYGWLRCGYVGAPCIAIAGATSQTYTATSADVGATLRAVVTAKDSNGTNTATAAATVTVTGLPPTGSTTLPDGEVSVPVANVVAPQRIVIDAVEAPTTARGGSSTTLRIHVSDTRGYVVSGVAVSASSVPQTRALKITSVVTAPDGWATLKVTPAKVKKASVLVLAISASSSPAASTEEADEDASTEEDEVAPTPLLLAERIVRIPLTPAPKSTPAPKKTPAPKASSR